MIIKSKKKYHPMDNLATPDYLFEKSQKIYNVKCNIDVAATAQNTKCRRFITKKQDFLKQRNFKKTDILWGNFPHTKNKIFTKHLSEVVQETGCRALIIIPINTLCSEYAEKYIIPFVEISKKMLIKGRHKFLTPRSLKISKEPSVNGYVALLYRRKL